MSLVSFNNYATAAENVALHDTEKAGRYAFQADAERRILSELLNKLDLQPTDQLLEIGCGPGNLIIPLAHFVARAVGIDNQAAIDRLHARAPTAANLQGIAGDFLTLQLPTGHFDKILIYSVLHYLSSAEEALLLIDRALSLLAPGGRLLLGDLPNQDLKRRFGTSGVGQRTAQEWQKNLAAHGSHAFAPLPADPLLIAIDDKLILRLVRHIREKGYEAYMLPQDKRLPFGNTREDILVSAHS